MLRQKTLETVDANKEQGGETQEIVEVSEVEVNEEEVPVKNDFEKEEDDLDPKQVRQGRQEKMDYMVLIDWECSKRRRRRASSQPRRSGSIV